MGQGTDSCGGWELEYDPISEGLETGNWVNGQPVSSMTTSHIRNAIRHARMRSKTASFSCTSEDWDEWVDLLETELARRSCAHKAPKTNSKQSKPIRGATQQMKCFCGTVYKARTADLKRGWAQTCSKRCAGIRREYGRPAATKSK